METRGDIFALLSLNLYALQRFVIQTLSILASQPSSNFPIYSLVHFYTRRHKSTDTSFPEDPLHDCDISINN